jgi:hypothetical protein
VSPREHARKKRGQGPGFGEQQAILGKEGGHGLLPNRSMFFRLSVRTLECVGPTIVHGIAEIITPKSTPLIGVKVVL